MPPKRRTRLANVCMTVGKRKTAENACVALGQHTLRGVERETTGRLKTI
ncbi:hypothetical protein [Kingella potus]|nr:hypothetical protein [Kingella potus]UOP00961.1 hypothetical protein LVJ84_00655 [Kingella potus]